MELVKSAPSCLHQTWLANTVIKRVKTKPGKAKKQKVHLLAFIKSGLHLVCTAFVINTAIRTALNVA